MSEHSRPNPDKKLSQKAAEEAYQKALEALGKPIHSDTESPQPFSPELQAVRDQLPSEYQVYSDRKEELGEPNLYSNKEFLEFFSTLNSNYIALFKDFVDKKEIWNPETFQEKMEFFKSNYSLPLTDEEAVHALPFLNKEQNPTIEIAQKKVEAWRKLSAEWGCPPETSIISLARGGFNIKETAPSIRDQKTNEVDEKGEPLSKGLCYEDFKYLKKWNFEDTPTTDEIRFLIPRLVQNSTGLNFADQTARIAEITQKLQKQYPEWNIQLTMGEANQIANQILAHCNQTEERIPLKTQYARTLTRGAVGRRLFLGSFGADGLYCYRWAGEHAYGHVGVFALGVEKLGH